MTITNECLKRTARVTLSDEGKIGREYNEQRLVKSTVELSEYALGTQLGYLLGSGYPTDYRARLVDYSIDRHMTKAPNCAWDVSLRYSTLAPPTVNNSDDPTQQRVKRSWQTSEHTMYTFKDRNGKMIKNSAKQPFDGGVPVTLELPTLVYERNESTFNGTWATQWSNSINQYTYSGASPKTLKLKISATEQFEGDYHFWSVRYEMAYLPIGWQPQPLNAGLTQLVSDNLVACYDSNKVEVSSPVPLDSAGKQIEQASLPDAAYFIEVDWFPQTNFSGLGLQEFA